ncbi:MAG: TonB-dependent receptor [Bacteroidia bacterium]|nr:TonB-dependent receptor [Bacteroidia bacterium]
MRKVVNNIALCILLLSAEPISAYTDLVRKIDKDSTLSSQTLPPENIPKTDTVFVSIRRISFAQIGRLSQEVAPTEQGAVLTQDLLQSGAFFKQYGISGSATISKRGADATQTQVLWNGLPINHPMLGMTDFNNFSTFGLSELTFIDGGNSAMYGSGSVGGTVLMNHDANFNKGKIVQATGSIGSFNNHQYGATLGYSGKLAAVQFSQSVVNQPNTFSFYDRHFELKRKAVNSEFQQYISRILATVQLSKYSQAKLVLENARMNRGLGMLSGSFNTLGNQKDVSKRGVVEYKYKKGRFAWIQKFGASQDQIIFTQSGIPDTSHAQLRFAMSEAYFIINPKTQILMGFDFQQQRGNTQYYKKTQIRNLPAQFISLRQKRNKTQWLASARWEWQEKIPSAGIGQETQIRTNWVFKSDLHSSFRRATLNDLYWAQPGNATLKNELGWEAEAGIASRKSHFNWELTLFYRELQNPIIWMPSGGLWAARNYHFGRYYGFQSHLQYQSIKWFARLSTDWVRTRVQAYERSDFLQQIFIPDLMANIQLGMKIKNWNFAADLAHTGNRFIQTDNEKVIPSYQLLGAQVKFTLKKQSFILNAQNLLNTVYENMPGRPMPGTSIQFHFNYKL